MATHRSLAKLYGVLAYLYPDEYDARRIAEQIGLDVRRIKFSGHSINNWHATLTEANKVGMVESVLNVVVEEYENNDDLLKAVMEWRHSDFYSSDFHPTASVVDMLKKFDWVTIPAGEFLMGSDETGGPAIPEHERPDMPWIVNYLLKQSKATYVISTPPQEMPQHSVGLPEFCISRIPVTIDQYRMFVNATAYESPEYWNNLRMDGHPVTGVSWYDAQAFCEWAGVRLPTEAEWEKAARGTDGLIYPWGDNLPDNTLCNFNSNEGATTIVGSYPKGASPYHVLDMAGNVWEWTSSLAWDYPYEALDGRESPQVPTARVLRGGSWVDEYHRIYCSFRDDLEPYNSSNNLGFRVAINSPLRANF